MHLKIPSACRCSVRLSVAPHRGGSGMEWGGKCFANCRLCCFLGGLCDNLDLVFSLAVNSSELRSGDG